MFALFRRDPALAKSQTACIVSRVSSARLWAVRSVSAALASAIAVGSVWLGAHVIFAQSAIGGASGLFALYASTAAVGIGLAVLLELVALARRWTERSRSTQAEVISMSPTAPRPAEARSPEWTRPFNAA